MIGYLHGSVKSKNEKSVLLLVNNVGYRVFVPDSVLIKVKNGQEIDLYTHLSSDTREETQTLYGFTTEAELKFFERLIKITGVGPRSALATLSVASPGELKRTIAKGDPTLLQKVAGIGKKTAERIIVELRDKIEPTGELDSSDSELMAALEKLGYKMPDIRLALHHIPSEVSGSAAKLKAALKFLGR